MLSEISDKRRISVSIRGKTPLAHFLEQAVCNLPLLGAEHVADDNVVGEHGRGIECLVVDPVEESEGALPIGLT